MGFVVVGFCIFDDAVDSFGDVVDVIGIIIFAVVDSFVNAVDGPLIFFDNKIDSCLDIDVVGCVILVVVDSCFGAVAVERFAFDVAVDSFVDVVDVCFI